MLQKERDKREQHAQGTKNLRTAYINRIYEAEKAQVEDEFQVRVDRCATSAPCSLKGSFSWLTHAHSAVALHRRNSENTRRSCSRGSERR